MKVCVLGYGRIWSTRPAKEHRPAAYFNTTGVLVQGKPRPRSRLYGYVRIDQCLGFHPDKASQTLHGLYETEGFSLWRGCNKLFLQNPCPKGAVPDRYLVCISDAQAGKIDRRANWLCDAGQVISFSEGNNQQETLLLLPAFAWIRTAAGLFGLVPVNGRPWIAGFDRYGE
jgi:hypothetical protein